MAQIPVPVYELGVAMSIPAAILLLVTLGFGAQDRDKLMALTQPGEHHKQLGPLAGSWAVAVKFKFGGREMVASATCESKWVLGGRFLEQDYKAASSGMPLDVKQYLGYDNQKKKFVEIKMDNMDTGVLHNEGTISADGKVITFLGERIDPLTGKANKLRTVTSIIDTDHYTLEWFITGADGKEERIVTMSHSRRQ
jgi:uncharacterized protein DUF1579